MGFNWSSVVNFINSLKSPEAAIDWMLAKGEKKDPQLATALRRMIKSGEDPTKVLKHLSSKGQINIDQLYKIKKCYNMVQKFGMKQKIPDAEWTKAENAIKSAGIKNKNGFTGF